MHAHTDSHVHTHTHTEENKSIHNQRANALHSQRWEVTHRFVPLLDSTAYYFCAGVLANYFRWARIVRLESFSQAFKHNLY